MRHMFHLVWREVEGSKAVEQIKIENFMNDNINDFFHLF